ncbi:ribosome silencing factor [Saccharibacillus endophyticus]|uniref:Ribosomal silencing factor RsfS n=1 Tax=Saccharibacillus endophyticus TaxID=2060666 RepID=A0ABQ1ZR69_9BACL|nr:ribosome silencing factor [Saccharibacillus endophyticus]GGH74662.1 ribosomal silencing factor RsfS [Saccharibacillus endophyticus]
MSVKPKELLHLATEAVAERKAMNVVALDLTGISLVADYFVVCHGNSDTQVQAIANEVRKRANDAGAPIRGIEGMDSARWVLIDLGDVIVHVFHRDEREYYNIERVWSDAKVVETV